MPEFSDGCHIKPLIPVISPWTCLKTPTESEPLEENKSCLTHYPCTSEN